MWGFGIKFEGGHYTLGRSRYGQNYFGIVDKESKMKFPFPFGDPYQCAPVAIVVGWRSPVSSTGPWPKQLICVFK